jgi:RNase H-fold protein (predicted Holliday junction resolvase)
MAVDPQVVVNIASEFTGKKAFKQADTATQKLSKSTKNLSKRLIAVFSVTAVLAFGRAVSRTFSDAQKEAKLLENALNGVNLGFAAPFIGQFIDKLALATGKSGGDLTNAFVALSGATGDATTAQKLLNTALDISAGTGKDLQSVSVALGRAFKGETTALAKLRIGFSTAELQAMDFNELLQVLQNRFKGAGANAADSYAGKLARIGEAADLAKEKIGEGFVDGLEASGMSVEDFQENIVKLGTAIGTALGKAVGALENLKTKLNELSKNPAIKLLLKGLDALVGLDPITGTAADMQDKTNKARKQAAEAYAKELNNRAVLLKISKAEALASKKKLNELKKMSKEKAAQLKLDKAALALGKAEDVFDLDQIQIAAAILSTQENIQRLGVNATDQQKLQLANDAQRLTVKQLMLDLEDAIAAKDVERATSLSKQLNTELAILGTLTGQTYKLGQIDKILASFVPKDLINLDNLDAAIRKLLEIAGSRFDFLSPIITSPDRSGINDLDQDIFNRYKAGDPEAIRAVDAHADAISMLAESELALADALLEESIRALDIATASLSPSVATSSRGFDPAAFRMADNITVNVNAGVIGNEDSVEQAVQKAILSIERKGDPLRYTGGL